MADNYLEKRYEEVFGKGSGARSLTPVRASLDKLLHMNRSFRGYDKSHVVHRRQMDAIVAVNPLLASGGNAQSLRFHIVTKGDESATVLKHIRMGAALPELKLPFPGTEPEAFVVVCSTCEETPVLDIDLGISLQSMLLKSVDLGLGGLIIRNFDREAIRDALGLPFQVVAVLAIGKPAEKVELVTVHKGDKLNYYREDGVHKVPKLAVEDLLV